VAKSSLKDRRASLLLWIDNFHGDLGKQVQRYTSMLVAAVQAQGEALAKLQSELAQVKRKLRVK
jgi:hypothetical protein